MADIHTQIRTHGILIIKRNNAETRRNQWWARRDLNPRPIRYERSSAPRNARKYWLEDYGLGIKRIEKVKKYVPNTYPTV